MNNYRVPRRLSASSDKLDIPLANFNILKTLPSVYLSSMLSQSVDYYDYESTKTTKD